MRKILLLAIVLLILPFSASALAFNNLSFGGTGAVNTGNGYFDDPGLQFSYSDTRNVYLISEDSRIYILEPINYANGEGQAYQLVNSSLNTIKDSVAYHGYIYFVDGTTLKKRKGHSTTNLCESTDTSAGGCITTISTGVGETLRVLDDVLYFTKGSSSLHHLDSNDNEVTDFVLSYPPTAGDTQFKGFTVYKRSGALTIIYTGWSGAAVFSVVCNSVGCSLVTNIVGANQNTWTSGFTTTNNYYYYVYQNGGTNVEEYRYISNNTNHAQDYLPTDTIAQANRIYVGSLTTIGLEVFSATIYQTFNSNEIGTDSLPVSEGSGIVEYVEKTVSVPNPTYYNDSIIPLNVNLKFIISDSNHTNYSTSAFWHLKAINPSGIEVEDHDLPIVCVQQQPWWDPFGVLSLFIVDLTTPWACDGTQTVNYVRSEGQFWMNGTWTVELTEQIPGTTSILSTDTWNIINQTSGGTGSIGSTPSSGGGLGGTSVSGTDITTMLSSKIFWTLVFIIGIMLMVARTERKP